MPEQHLSSNYSVPSCVLRLMGAVQPTVWQWQEIRSRIRKSWPEVVGISLRRSELIVLTSAETPSADQYLAAANALRISEEVLGCALSLRWAEHSRLTSEKRSGA